IISGGTLSDAIGNLAAGDSVTITVSASTPAGYSATLDNTATASATNNSPGSVSASASDIVLAPNLAIAKVGGETVNATDLVHFTIVVSNSGAGTAYGVSLTDALPACLSWRTSDRIISGGTLSAAMGNLAAGASVTIHVSASTPAGY